MQTCSFFNIFCFEKVSAMTFSHILSNFLQNDIQSDTQSDTQFGPPDHPSDLPPDLPPKNKIISTPSLHFWRRNAPNKQVFDARFAILKVQCHSRKRWFRVDETPILEVGRGAPCRPVAFFRAFCFEEVSAITFSQIFITFLRSDPQSDPRFGPPNYPPDHHFITMLITIQY